MRKFVLIKRLSLLSCVAVLYGMVVLSTSAFRSHQTYQVPAGTKMKLSEYGFFVGDLAELKPAADVLPYTLNTPLFSDYAHKARFIRLPEGQTVAYNDQEVFDFPVGTALIKTFYYPQDFRDASNGRNLIETRVLLHQEKGWVALPYVWDEAQAEAYLEVAGVEKEVVWKDDRGKKNKLNYLVPNMNQCQGCHNFNEKMTPIGPSARQLNSEFAYATGAQNQLTKWQAQGWLTDLPANLDQIPRVPNWSDPHSGSLAERARAYLDINCGHCHRPEGPASTSGLFLHIHEQDETALGVHKTPVAAGRGSGGRQFDIVPGQPDASILVYRMESKDPGVMMPEVSRKLAHEEGIALIKEWIEAMNTAEK